MSRKCSGNRLNKFNTFVKSIITTKLMEFIDEFQKILVLPIKRAILDSNKSLSYHCKELNKNGGTFKEQSLKNLLYSTNFGFTKFTQFAFLYEYFAIPTPTIDTFPDMLIEAKKAIEDNIKSRPNDKRLKANRERLKYQ